jgi:hypothetical protein
MPKCVPSVWWIDILCSEVLQHSRLNTGIHRRMVSQVSFCLIDIYFDTYTLFRWIEELAVTQASKFVPNWEASCRTTVLNEQWCIGMLTAVELWGTDWGPGRGTVVRNKQTRDGGAVSLFGDRAYLISWNEIFCEVRSVCVISVELGCTSGPDLGM